MLEFAWSVWNRRKWVAIVLFVVPFTAAASYIAGMPNIYQSAATVLVERQQVPEAFVRPTVTSELETRLRMINQEILSRPRLQALITRFGLYADLRSTEPEEAILERMRTDIRLELRGGDTRGRGSTIAFAISYRGKESETVAQVANTLASFYIEENLKARERQATGTAQFLDAQLKETRARLDEQEHRVSEFKKRYAGELPQQLPSNLATVEQINTQLRLNHLNRMLLAQKRELSGAPATPESSLLGLSPEERVGALTRQLEELRTRFTDGHPAVIAKKAEIAGLEERLARESSPRNKKPEGAQSAPSKGLNAGAGESSVLKDDEVRLKQALAIYEQRVANTPLREQQFQEISRDYEATKELYQSLLKRHGEAQLAENMEQRQKGEQFRILEPAIASKLPAAPQRTRLIVIALILCVGLAGGAVALTESLDTSFHTLDALRSFTIVPVLTSIPRIVIDSDTRRARWRFRLAATATTLVMILVVGVTYFLAHGKAAFLR